MTLGSGAMSNSVPDVSDEAEVILVIGSNAPEAHPMIGRRIVLAKERGAKLIVIDPRQTELSNKADIWLRIPIGYNIPVLNGLAHVIIEEKLYKADFIKEHAEGFEDLARAVEEYTPEYVERLTGIPRSDLVKTARMYAQAKAASILYGMGICESPQGTAGVVCVSNLAVLTGNLGRPGTGICPLRGQNNVQGVMRHGLPAQYPARLPQRDR